MAKWFGHIGFVRTVETAPDVWQEQKEELPETEAALEEIEALEADEEDISGQENGFEVIEPEDAEDKTALTVV